MGSCVSHCSRQDVVHQQTGRVITGVQKSIELTSDTALQKSLSGVRTDVKDLSAGDNVTRNKSVLSSVKLLTPDTRDVRDQINAEIRALREQLVRSQVLFTYLLKNSSSESTKSPDGKKELCTLLEGGALGDAMFQCKSFDGQALARLYNRSNRSSSSYTSHRSTPMHCGYTSLSCPTLPIDYPVITKSTQTEPLCGASLYVDRSNADRIITSDSTHSLNKGTLFFSPPSTPCGTIPETYLLSEICEIHQEPEDHSFPRHRTNSFLSAVKEGNPKLVDVENEKGQTAVKQTPGDMHESVQKMDRLSSASCNLPSTSKVCEVEEKLFSEDTNKIDVSALEQKIIAERGASVTPTKGVLERAKSDGDAKLIDEKNGASKSLKYSQRSLRRGSGAGSPNSLLTIPRCPAFDFSEQEDVHSIFPPLSEPESYSSFKTESYQGVHKSDNAADKEYSQNTLRLKDTSQKKRDTSKSKSLMPEFMENSETESTKGSFECEALELPSNTEAPSIPDIAFPSLPNTFLAKLGVHKDSPLPVEAFDEQDLESKFIALSLAFKTDRSTLNKRLELHKRQRDMAEKNVENEFQSMRDHLSALNLKATNSDIRDLISKIQNHLDIAQQATSRVSGRSETYGAVQQEERVSRAFEVLVLHVDHLKRLFDKEHKELEETKRMLTDTRVFKKDFTADIVTEDQKKYSKTFGLPVSSIKSVGRRRASVADFHPRSFLENCKSPEFSQSWTSGLSVQRVEPKQPSVWNSYPMTSTTVGLISNSLPTSSIASKPPARKPSTTGISSRRCSLPAANPIMAPKMSPEAVSNEPTPPAVPFPSKLFNSKKDRNVWTRKLSSVTDEKEQSEEEVDLSKLENKTENGNISEISMEHFMLRAFLQEVEMKNSELYETFDNQFDDYENLSDHVESSEKKWYKITFKIVLQFILNSTVGKYLKNPRIQEVWHQNSTLTLIRYFCSGVLVFVAFCCLCSLILPCLGMNFDFIQGMCATVFSIIIFH